MRVPDSLTTIQAAVDASNDFDTILVAPGIYRGEGNRDIRFYAKGIVVKAQSESGLVTVDCEGTEAEPHRAFYFPERDAPNAVIDGFTLCNGYSDTGGVVYGHYALVRFQECTFNNNRALTGGAVGGRNFAASFSQCQFIANTAEHGGAISDITGNIDSCQFIGNSASWGGAVSGEDLEIRDCWFEANAASSGGQAICGSGILVSGTVFARHRRGYVIDIGSEGGCKFSNCTFFDNHGVVFIPWLSVAVIESCVMAYNRAYCVECEWFYDQGEVYRGAARVFNSLLYGNYHDYFFCAARDDSANGNISLDPLFCDTAGLDLYLAGNSPCLGAGINGSDVGALGVGCVPTGIDDNDVQPTLPKDYRLYQNHPNPFNPVTNIQFDVPSSGTLKLEVFNVLGQLVATIIDEHLSAGHHTVLWNADSMPSGVYLYRLRSATFSQTRKMLLLK